MRTSGWVVGLVLLGACQAGDDRVSDETAERLPPPLMTLGDEKQIDRPVAGYRRGRPVDSHIMWNGTIRTLIAWRPQRPAADGPVSDIVGVTYSSKGTVKPPY